MAGSTRYSYPTLPLRGKFAKIFPQNHGNGRFAATARRRIMAAKKPCLAARKNVRFGFARGSPQRNHMRLMLRAAWFRRRSLSASRVFGFRDIPHGDQAARHSRMLDKCFN
jgi:hypothetical protein